MAYYYSYGMGGQSSWAVAPGSGIVVAQQPAPPMMSRPWSKAEDKVFQSALLTFPEQVPNQWALVASWLQGRMMQEAWDHYQALLADVDLIEHGMVEVPMPGTTRAVPAMVAGMSAAAACHGRRRSTGCFWWVWRSTGTATSGTSRD
ncbi:hypothetical protein EJB05_49562, partial [Eragrostis curvula]